MSYNLHTIILAAGRAKRFNTGRTKLVEKICGQEMILYPLTLFKELNISTTLVLGYQRDIVETLVREKNFANITYAYQDEQRGTGHAVLCSRPHWQQEHILIINGDMPLITADIIKRLYEKHIETNASISFVIAHNVDPSLNTYGRIVKQKNSIKIVEPKEFNGDVNQDCCVNAGIYLVRRDFLESQITTLQQNSVTAEFHITDLVEIASTQTRVITTVSAPFDQIRGVNTFKELWAVEQIKKSELITFWMEHGVHFPVAQNVHLDVNIAIGAGSTIGSGSQILNGTKIGKNCTIEEFVVLENALLDDNSSVFSHCVIKDSAIGAHATVGPFAHLRNQSVIGEHVVVGNFVEIKKSTLGTHTKVKHLSYLGDATVGARVNIGAGTITCNHNGQQKQATTIEDDAYVGVHNTLVAPVTLGKNCFTAAGSVITENVPADALAIARTRQTNKEGYALKLKKKSTEEKKDGDVVQKHPETPYVGVVKTNNNSSVQGT